MRTAIVLNKSESLSRVLRYLPSNYTANRSKSGFIVITGSDHMGWTLTDYVIPRLASGLIFAQETDKA